MCAVRREIISMQRDEQQIRELVRTWMEASKAGDLRTVLGLMAEDVIFLVAGRPPMVGRKAFEEASKAMEGAEQPEFDGTGEIQEIHVSGDWAYMWAKLTVVVKPPGGAETITRAGTTLSILKKENGRWVMFRDANMLVRV
jgi:uncharacterized protein (TIGR02246 family)